MYTIDVLICWWCQWTLAIMLIQKLKNTDYLCIITGIRKNESLMLLQNIDLTEKVWNILKLNIKSNFEALNLLQILI